MQKTLKGQVDWLEKKLFLAELYIIDTPAVQGFVQFPIQPVPVLHLIKIKIHMTLVSVQVYKHSLLMQGGVLANKPFARALFPKNAKVIVFISDLQPFGQGVLSGAAITIGTLFGKRRGGVYAAGS